MRRVLLVQLSMSATASLKKGSSSWCTFSTNLDSYYWWRYIVKYRL